MSDKIVEAVAIALDVPDYRAKAAIAAVLDVIAEPSE